MSEFYVLLAGSTHNPVPQATLTGHTTPISCVVISAELGIVVSSSQGERAQNLA